MKKSQLTPELSIVTTLYKSAKCIEQFLNGIVTAVQKLGISNYEIIVVNDGSPDESADILLSLMGRYQNITFINLSRNFGHHKAFQAGMSEAKGELVFNIDSDLETDPMELCRFYDFYKEHDVDVVYGYQEQRKGSLTEKITGQLFWKAINKLSGIEIPQNITTERLMTKQYVAELMKLKEATPFLGGLMYWVGFDQKGIPVQRKQRIGKASYNLRMRLNLLLDAVTSLSAYPLKLVFKAGFVTSIVSFLVLLFFVIRKLVFPESILMGYTSFLSVTLFTFGILIMSIGIVGIYLERVFNESKERPNYIVKEIRRN